MKFMAITLSNDREMIDVQPKINQEVQTELIIPKKMKKKVELIEIDKKREV